MFVGNIQSISFVVVADDGPGELVQALPGAGVQRTRYPFECREDGGDSIKWNGDLRVYCERCQALQLVPPRCLRTDPERKRRQLRGQAQLKPVRLCVECHQPLIHGQGQLCAECAETRIQRRRRNYYMKGMHLCAYPGCSTMVLAVSRFCKRHCKRSQVDALAGAV